MKNKYLVFTITLILMFALLFFGLYIFDTDVFQVLFMETFFSFIILLCFIIPLSKIIYKEKYKYYYTIMFLIRIFIMMFLYFFISTSIITIDIFLIVIGGAILLPISNKVEAEFSKKVIIEISPPDSNKLICKDCGMILQENDKFCSNCGSSMDTK